MAQTEAPPVVAPATPSDRTSFTALLWQGGTLLALVVLVILFGALQPDAFLSFGNVRNILAQIAILAIIASAQTVVMVVGDFDLSVGVTATLAGATAAALMIDGWSIPLAIVAALVVGTLVGVVNGILVAYMNLSAFVATLATLTSVGGLAFIVTDGTTLFGMPESFEVIGQGRPLGLPLPIFFAVIVCVVVWLVLKFTTIGRRWYAVGGSAEVARLSGVNVRLARFLAFTVAGFVSAIGGIILVSRLASASATSANNYMLLAVAAVFLGMTVLRSGAANVGGTLVGVGIIGVMSNGLNIVGVSAYFQQVFTGLIIIAAVTLSALKSRSH
ncbi:ABC transporter permease [Geodermatophilus sabuli]|uniref:ABC transporter permease n=1 Tax=Geodermatophilus sabuli TaxID=1564158 RepID=A0A7K3VUT2_9ACTN|nr:ABC transporter permease [Geodermatophilus sabuli]NEK56405.1 ABC transporter permease [Geodermatophilus sabuli]